MILTDTIQGQPEWFAARCGIASASQFSRVFTTKLEISKSWQAYAYQLAGERITLQKTETFQSWDMARGTETEPEAVGLYQLVSGNEVTKTGFVLHDSGAFGCSPDGLVEDNGAIEAKCPRIHTHIGYLMDNKLPTDYWHQCHGTLAVTGREWLDFFSYYPGLPLFVHRVQSDAKVIGKITEHLLWFDGEVAKVENQLRAMG